MAESGIHSHPSVMESVSGSSKNSMKGRGSKVGSSLRRSMRKLKVDDNDAEVLLQKAGSGPINCALFIFFFMYLLGLVYAIYVVGSSVHLCQESIQQFFANPWYNAIISLPPPNATIGVAFQNLRVMLAVDAERKGGNLVPEDQWLTPWCSWCDDASFLDSFNTSFTARDKILNFSLLEKPDFDEDTAKYDLGIAKVAGLVSPTSSGICVTSFILPMYRSMVNTDFAYPDGVALKCLLGEYDNIRKPLVCYPCGDSSVMQVRVSASNGTKILVDSISNRTIPLDKAYILYARCAYHIVHTHLSPCRDGSKFYTGFVRPPSREVEKEIPKSTSKLSMGTSVFGGHAKASMLNSEDGAVSLLVTKLRNDILTRGPQLASVTQNCSQEGLPDISSLVSGNPYRGTGLSFDNVTHSMHKDKWDSTFKCWALFSLFLSNTESCMAPEASRQDQLVFPFYLGVLEAYFTREAKFDGEYVLPDGLSATSYASLVDNRKSFDTNEQYSANLERLANSSECVGKLKDAPAALKSFTQFFTSMRECDPPAEQLAASRLSNGVLFILACLMLLFVILSFLFGGEKHRSRYSASIICLVISMVFISKPSVFYNGLDWGTATYILVLFFNRGNDDLDSKNTFTSMSSGFFLGFAYLHFTLTLVAAAKSSQVAPISGSRKERLLSNPWFHAGVAVAYMAIRGPLIALAFHAELGIVPFVNWISVIRICNNEHTLVSPFPECASKDNQADGSLPFFGILLGTIVDAVVLIILKLTRHLCLVKIAKQPFARARSRYLITFVQRIYKATMAWGILFSSIIYCSVVEVMFGYGAYVSTNSVQPEIKNVGLQRTGVIHWNIGVILIYWVYGISWLFLMQPRFTWVARFVTSWMKEEDGAVRFFPTEKHVRDSRDPGKERHHALFDKKAFVLETQLMSILGSFSCYQVDQDGGWNECLPPGFTHVEYIYDELLDGHAWVYCSKYRIHVSFRGTYSAKNAATDLKIGLIKLSWESDEHTDPISKRAQETIEEYSGGKVKACLHVGFFKSFQRMQTRISAAVQSCLDEDPERKTIICAGHSLGGALATVCGLYLSTGCEGDRYIVQVSTIGAPRPGNRSFCTMVDHFTASFWRMVKRGDVIPKTPPSLGLRIPFTEVGTSSYFHPGVEVLLDLSGDTVIDPTITDHLILHRFAHGGPLDHSSGAYLISILMFAMNVMHPETDDDLEGRYRETKIQLWENCRKYLFKSATGFSKMNPNAVEKVQEFARLTGTDPESPEEEGVPSVSRTFHP